MDSDDIVVPSRIIAMDLYEREPKNKIGGQVQMFDDNGNNRGVSNHPSLSWETYKTKKSHWFINHPTVCYENPQC